MEAVAESTEAELAAIVEPDLNKGKHYSLKYGVKHFTNVDDLVKSDLDYNMVSICTLPELHYTDCVTFLNLKKNIFCEKPVSRKYNEIVKLSKLAKKKGCMFGVNFNQRYGKSVIKAKELLMSDSKVQMINGSMYQQGPRIIKGHVNGNFLITDSCCHLIDLMTYLNGKAKKVCILLKSIESEIITDISVIIEFENNSIGNMSHSFVGGRFKTQHPFQKIEIHTEKAKYDINNLYDSLIVFYHDKYEQIVYTPSVFESRDYSHSIKMSAELFIKAIANEIDLPVNIDEAIHNASIINSILKSLKSGRFEDVL
jgi:predicted dehydrogenase